MELSDMVIDSEYLSPEQQHIFWTAFGTYLADKGVKHSFLDSIQWQSETFHMAKSGRQIHLQTPSLELEIYLSPDQDAAHDVAYTVGGIKQYYIKSAMYITD